MLDLFTIGYEGTDIGRVIDILSKAGVRFVADIRERPLSRKPGFSKTMLQKMLAENQIGYEHFRNLGDPKEGREAARAGDHALFREIYDRQIETIGAYQQLEALAAVARTQPTCLLCFEKDPAECHRTIVASRMAEEGFQTVHLFTDRNIVEHRAFGEQPGGHPGQGFTAA